MSNPLKAMMPNQSNINNPMNMIMKIMSSPNKEQTAMEMLSQVNPQAYQMIKQGATPENLMRQYGITSDQITQMQQKFR